jgi:hypothetical protein
VVKWSRQRPRDSRRCLLYSSAWPGLAFEADCPMLLLAGYGIGILPWRAGDFAEALRNESPLGCVAGTVNAAEYALSATWLLSIALER